MNQTNISNYHKKITVEVDLFPMKDQYLYLNNELSYIENIFTKTNIKYFTIITIKNNKKNIFSITEFYDLYYSKKIKFVESIKSDKTTYLLNEYYLLNNSEVQISNILKPLNKNNKDKLNLNEKTNRINLYSLVSYDSILTLEEADEKLKPLYKKENTTNYRKKYLPEFRADDGHYVRSQGEMIIDNWLYNNNISHEYEKKIILKDEEYFADFYIRDKNLYIEYFGITNNDDYTKKAEHKKSIYKENNINCIYLYPEDLKNIQDILQKTIINNIKIN